MKIYIVRHGETESNKLGRLQGQIDEKLNENGILLAELTGDALKGVHFDKAYSSHLIRAKKTAEIILERSNNTCPIEIDDRIIELNMGTYEGKSIKGDDPSVDMDMISIFMTNPLPMTGFPSGETFKGFLERTQSFLKELADKDYETVLVSTHGCALRAMLNFIYEDKEDFWHGHVPYNCAVNVLEVKDGNFRLIEDDSIYYDRKYIVDRYERK